MKILVTGIAGFIGFHVARHLAARGDAVVGIDDLNPYYDTALKRARLEALGGDVAFHRLDVSDHAAVAALVRGERPDVVLHLAAQAGVRHSIDDPFSYARSNLCGHLAVLEACRNADGLSHLVYASSSSVYGDGGSVPFRESDRVDRPVSLYAATKRADELMSATYAHLYGLRQIGLRFFTVYGPWGRPDMAYWTFTEAVLSGEPIRVFNEGRMRRDFTHIDDVVAGVIATLDAPVFGAEAPPHRLYNLGSSRPVDLMEMIALIERHAGRKADIRFEPMQPGDVTETYADIAAMKADYGFVPKVPLNEGLEAFVAWYRRYARTPR